MATDIESLKQAALDYVNDCRRQLGASPIRKLRPGRREQADRCPITNSIKATTLSDIRWDTGPHACFCSISGRRVQYNLPDKVREFVLRFDKGELPELIAKKAR